MLTLVIANKLYSSWSMRPWLVLKHFGIPFEEVTIPLRQPDSREKVLKYSPSGKVPALVTPHGTVWESMAIIEYLADAYPDKAIWPTDPAARAHARAISNEMHGGFQTIRQSCPMHMGARFRTPEITVPLQANIDRIEEIWAQARTQFRTSGSFLYGPFTAADAMYAPVVCRMAGYQLPVSDATRVYMNSVQAHPAYIAWRAAALKEEWTIADYASGHTLLETYR